jgi:hypothetical protein
VSNSTFNSAFSTQLAELTRIVAVPTGPLGYGTDLSCVTDLDPLLVEVDPNSPAAIVEAVIRRFTTPRGSLIDDPDYGLDIRSVLNRGMTQRDLRALAGALRGEAQKDDRVALADVQLTVSLPTREASVQVFITPEDSNLRDFSFTFAVTDGDVLRVTING